MNKIYQLDVIYGQKYTETCSVKYRAKSLRETINTFCKAGFISGVRPHKINVEVDLHSLELIGPGAVTKKMADYHERIVRFRVSVPRLISLRTVTVRIRRIS